MRRKKIILVCVLIIIFFIIAFLIYFRPQPVIKDMDSCDISNIVYRGTNITDEADHEEILHLLSKYKCKASFERMQSYQTEDVIVEIDGTDNNKPFHIVLGETYIKYEYAGEFVQNIIDGNKLADEIEEITRTMQ
jgi:hypothetical protein